VYRRDTKSQLACIKLMERRARVFGLDHADGINERAVRVEEAKATLLFEVLTGALDNLSLPDQQVQQIKAAVAGEVRARLSA
jgi:hypothetical protein